MAWRLRSRERLELGKQTAAQLKPLFMISLHFYSIIFPYIITKN